ncbi:MAG: glycine zipper 2TM domain-containing protein, partial [Arenimonas sp.]
GLAAAQDYRNDSRYDNNNSNNSSYNNGRYGNYNPRSDYAQVIRVERNNSSYGAYQRQECWNEQTNDYDDGYYRDDSGRLYRGDDRNSKTGVVVGAIVGGALGNQVGNGDGKKAATIAGAVIGAAVGNKVAQDNKQYEYRDETANTVRRCRTVYDDNNNSNYGNYESYKVTYRYAGQTYQGITDYRPGRSIRVVVDVRLQDNRQHYGNR